MRVITNQMWTVNRGKKKAHIYQKQYSKALHVSSGERKLRDWEHEECNAPGVYRNMTDDSCTTGCNRMKKFDANEVCCK